MPKPRWQTSVWSYKYAVTSCTLLMSNGRKSCYLHGKFVSQNVYRDFSANQLSLNIVKVHIGCIRGKMGAGSKARLCVCKNWNEIQREWKIKPWYMLRCVKHRLITENGRYNKILRSRGEKETSSIHFNKFMTSSECIWYFKSKPIGLRHLIDLGRQSIWAKSCKSMYGII